MGRDEPQPARGGGWGSLGAEVLHVSDEAEMDVQPHAPLEVVEEVLAVASTLTSVRPERRRAPSEKRPWGESAVKSRPTSQRRWIRARRWMMFPSGIPPR